MKTAIIYYSLEGNMDYIAKRIGDETEADLYRLVPKKEYPTGKISKFFWGGKSVTFGEKPELLNDSINLDDYDTLIIGSPIWAGTFAPPLNTFFHNYKINSKNIILVATHSGGGGEKCFTKIKQLLNDNTILGAFDFQDPARSKDANIDHKLNQIKKLLIKM
jgi:Flavodoxins